jgi:SAM-dependent methyltransferase
MPDVNSPQFWDQIYARGRAGWDLGRPTPVFHRLLHDGDLSPGRIMVLGAGNGHDARLFARHGFEVTAVDFAQEAVEAMRSQMEANAPHEVIRADIFHLPERFDEVFDFVLEYTFYCAIDPSRRDQYAGRVTRLLKPGGKLIALVFPITGHEGGPPFSVEAGGYIQRMEERGFTLLERATPPDSVPARKGVEELVILRKAEDKGG